MLYTGCRVGDLVELDLHDLMIGERSGSVTFRYGKGNKQRSCPLPCLPGKPWPLILKPAHRFSPVGFSSANGDH